MKTNITIIIVFVTQLSFGQIFEKEQHYYGNINSDISYYQKTIATTWCAKFLKDNQDHTVVTFTSSGLGSIEVVGSLQEVSYCFVGNFSSRDIHFLSDEIRLLFFCSQNLQKNFVTSLCFDQKKSQVKFEWTSSWSPTEKKTYENLVKEFINENFY